MSTAGGPRLEGIGRSGDSDIVLCMDAHDAGSYPGEPTTNYFIHAANGYPIGWWGDGGNQSGFTKSTHNVYDRSLQYNGYPTVLWAPGLSRNCYLNGAADIPDTEVSTEWTFSCYMKYEDGAAITSMSVYLYYSGSDGSAAGTIVDAGNGWYRVSRSRTGSSDHISLAGFTGITAEKKIYLSGPQLEKKLYPTPFVTGFTNSGEVYDSRPASTNLMIHGDVGTGTSFEDSSPSKHTITAHGNTTHSTTKSKFSGGSIYFDGTGDYLTIPASADWDVGTGDWTFDCWAYTTTSASYSYVFDTRSGSYTSNFSLYRTGLHLVYYAQVSALITATFALTLNTWHHVALVRNGSTVTMYVDGVSVGSATDANDYQGLAPFTIGTRYSIEGYWQGYQDEFRFTKGTALWLLESEFTPPTRRNNNGPLVDLSGHDNAGNFATKDMTDVSTYRDGQVIEPVASAVWDFDGTDDKITSAGPSFASSSFSEGLSVSTWIKLDSTTMTAADVSFAIRWASGAQNQFAFGYRQASSDKGISLYLWNDSNTQQDNYRTDWNPTAGIWYHVVGVFNPSNYVRIYIDGEIDYERTSSIFTSLNTSSTQDLRIGPFDAGSFEGLMGSLHIYEIALTHQQVKQNFNAQRSRFKV